MAAKIYKKDYVCSCGYSQIGLDLQFCGKCGKRFAKIDGQEAYVYINTCECCGDDISDICKKCESVPTPMTREQFFDYKKELDDRYSEISRTEWNLRNKTAAMNRIAHQKRGIDCECSATCICHYHSKLLD